MDLGAPEIIMLVLLAVVMFGPEKLPGIARKAARVVRYLNGIASDAKGQLAKELGPEWDDIKLSDLNPKTFVQRHLLDSSEVDEVRSALAESRAALESSTSDLVSATTGAGATAATTSGADLEGPASIVSPYDDEAT